MRCGELVARDRQPFDDRRRIAARHGDPRPERQTEVEHLDAAAGRDTNVGRLQIAMDHAVRVRFAERVAHCSPICTTRSIGSGPLRSCDESLAGHVTP